MLRVLVVGYGSVGKRYVENLLKYSNIQVMICTKRKDLNSEIIKKCEIFDSLDEGINGKPEIAFITNVTSIHTDTAINIAKSKINLFIEKPLSNSMDKIDELVEIINEGKIQAMVGCNFRFHNCLKSIKKLLVEGKLGKILSAKVECGSYLPDWHPNEDYRESYASHKKLGGGVVLTCIHEIDYLQWFFGKVKEIFSFSEKVSDLEVDVEDLSSSLLKFENNVIAELHLDYFQKPEFRSCKIIGTKGVIYWDSDVNVVKRFDYDKNKWIEEFKMENYSRNDMFTKELEYFLECVKTNTSNMNNISMAAETLKTALGIIESSNTKKVVEI